MKKIFLDFETRSKVDIKKSGTFAYAAHPSTKILCACWKLEDGRMKTWSPFLHAMDNIKTIYDTLVLDEYEIEAHNAQFEWAMWNLCGTKRYGFPQIPFSMFNCTAARAAARSLPRDLETLAKVLGLPIEKDMVGRRTMLKMCKPNKEGNFVATDKDFDILVKYCEQDVLVTEQVSALLPELSREEKEIFQLDFKINNKGILLDKELITNSKKFAEEHSDTLNKELSLLTNYAVTSATQNMKLTAYLQTHGVDVDAVDKASITEALKNVTDPKVKRVLEIRQSLAMSSVKKLDSMLSMYMSDNRARGTLLYAGANRTGRWSGKGIQIQNLPRGTVGASEMGDVFKLLKDGDYQSFKFKFPDVLGAISSAIRGMIIPPRDSVLMVGDFSAIEARVLFWMADHKKGVELYRNGIDAYKDMASFIYHKPYDQISKKERQLGKALILACGFGQGAAKFLETCAKEPYNLKLSNDQAQEAVDAYRTKHKPVKDFWYAVDKAAKQAINSPGQVYHVGKISCSKRGDFLFIKLPSGRKLSYFKPFIRTVEKDWGDTEQITFWGVDQETKKWGLVDTYGAKLVENITQATARDMMANAMLNVDKAGYAITMLVHDEIVAETMTGNVEEFKKLMETKADWMGDCPIGVEAENMLRYRK